MWPWHSCHLYPWHLYITCILGPRTQVGPARLAHHTAKPGQARVHYAAKPGQARVLMEIPMVRWFAAFAFAFIFILSAVAPPGSNEAFLGRTGTPRDR